MIICPQCAQTAPDGTRFCERCGRQLLESDPGSLLPALEVGHELARGYKIVELLSQSSAENWYRAVLTPSEDAVGPERRVLVRERLSPQSGSILLNEVVSEPPASKDPDQALPTGPKAPTQELPPVADAGSKPADAGAPDVDKSANESVEPKSETSSSAAQDTAADEAAQPDTALSAPREEDRSITGDSAPEGAQSQASAAREEDGAQQASPAVASPSNSVAQQSVQVCASSVETQPVEDLGELFGRLRDLSRTLNHPAFRRAVDSFRDNGRVYLAYPDEPLVKLSARASGLKMNEARALGIAIQVCQAVSFVHKRGFRMNDICPESVAIAPDGRVKLIGLEWVTNDNEVVPDPLLNDGYTAPEVYRGRRVDKRADIFSVACLLYTCLTGERIECETWMEESAPIRFYPPHVITPALEKVLRRALAFRPEDRYSSIDEFKSELVKLNSVIHLRSAAITDVGMVRELNEDSILALEYLRDSLIEPEQAFLYVVSDGMGGAAAGEVASAIAVATIREFVESQLAKDGQKALRLKEISINALEEANRKIIEYQQTHPEARGMGATGIVALLIPPKAAVAWVGDSRGYLHDANGLHQVTKDHSLVQRLVDIGQITPEQARHHEHKNVILRSLGARQSGPAGAEAVELTLKRGDRLLLCSDGLIAHVEDSQIGDILTRHEEPVEAARELIVAANAGGGTDNISVVLVFAE
jgi:serine/threonine protein phosphatase PrpC